MVYSQDKVYENREVTSPAYFHGGQEKLNQHINANLIYPTVALENDYTGEVNVVFTVDKYGNVKDIYTDGSEVHESLTEEAIRVIKSTSGQWVPAQKGMTKVNMIFSVPIKFWISGSTTDKEVVAEKPAETPEQTPKKKWWKLRKNK